MSTNEGVGKKIVEALKKQSNLEDEQNLVYVQDEPAVEENNVEMDYSLISSEGFESFEEKSPSNWLGFSM